MANDLVMRYQWESYMGIVDTSGSTPTTTYHLIGEGFTSFPEKKNPQEYTRKYINYKTEKTDVIGYSPSIEYSCDCISDDAVVQEIMKIHDGELVGNDTHREVVSVNLWEPVGSTSGSTTYKAFKRTFAIIPDQKGEGTNALIYTGQFKAVDDIVEGTFDTSTKTFTAS